jgi:hypothetical protein
MKYILLLVGLMALSAVDARDKFYKWTDAEGNIHYTQQKPLDKQVNVINIHDSVSSGLQIKKETETVTNKALTPEQKQVEEYNKALQAKAKAIQDKANCKVARKNLTTLQQTVRVRKKDPATGEYMRLDDNQRMQMLKLAKQSVKDLCQ